MRALFGKGTPKEAASVKNAFFFVIQSDVAVAIAIIAEINGQNTMLVIAVAPETD
jgi:transposase